MKRAITISAILMIAAAATCQARQPSAGYRGFIEWSNDLRSDKTWTYSNRTTTFYTGMTTSHGYQINPIFFIGAGIGLEKCNKIDNWIAPIFVQGRADLKFGRFTPFADLRLGANMAEGVGIYFSPSIGYRINWGRKAGINIGAGLTLGGYKAEYYEVTYRGPFDYELRYIETKHHVRPYFSFRLGFDF